MWRACRLQWRVIGLQWGRNFIVAEIPNRAANRMSSRCRFNGAATLSLRKYRGTRGERGDLPQASMGPQLYRCGNQAPHPQEEARKLASMGPQLYRCGNQRHRFHRTGKVQGLQWGRNFIVAEISLFAQMTYATERLQWGRNFIVAEIWRAYSSGKRSRSSFNGAATLSLRKYANTSVAVAADPRFNGAATLSLRKSCSSGSRINEPIMLQWGRNFIVAEITH